MEPAQRCVPGPGAWVDWEICLGSFFVRLRLSFFFFFSGEEPPIDVFKRVSPRSFSLSASPRFVCLGESDHHEEGQRLN